MTRWKTWRCCCWNHPPPSISSAVPKTCARRIKSIREGGLLAAVNWSAPPTSVGSFCRWNEKKNPASAQLSLSELDSRHEGWGGVGGWQRLRYPQVGRGTNKQFWLSRDPLFPPHPSLPLTWPEVKHASLSASSHLLHNYSLFGGVIITGICLPALKHPDRGFVFPPHACRFLCNVWGFFFSIFLKNWHGVSRQACCLKGVWMTWGVSSPPWIPGTGG